MTRRREYPEEDSGNDGSRRSHSNRDPLIAGDIQTKVGDPLTGEDTLMENPQRRISS